MTNRRRQSRAGMTLIELLIAVTLFGAISASMGVVLNIAFTSMNKIDAKVDFNRRVIASQRTLDQILQGLIPMVVPCGGRPIGIAANPASATFLSSHSLGGGSRGRPSTRSASVVFPDWRGPVIAMAGNPRIWRKATAFRWRGMGRKSGIMSKL